MEDFTILPARTTVPNLRKSRMIITWHACSAIENLWMNAFKLTEEAEKNLPVVEALLGKYPYCGHMRYEMAGMLLSPKAS